MPASRRSLQITEAYRSRMVALRERSQRAAQESWLAIDLADLEPTYENWRGAVSTAVSLAQRDAVRLSSAYLTAFISSELGLRVTTPSVNVTPYVGVSRDGRSLAEAYDSPRIGILVALKEGADNARALGAGLQRALRAVGLDTDHAARQSLADAMAANPRIAGWRRAVKGTCDACLGLADEALSAPGTPLEIHPGCECISEPAVKGAPDRFSRPSGTAIFAAMAAPEQDALFGAEKAQALRDGAIDLSDTVDRSRLEAAPDFITAKPLKSIPGAMSGDTNE